MFLLQLTLNFNGHQTNGWCALVLITVSALEFELVRTRQLLKSLPHDCQWFPSSSAFHHLYYWNSHERETGLNHFTVLVDKYHSYKKRFGLN